MRTRSQVVEILRANAAGIHAFGVTEISLFGSVARDEADGESDVDVLVDFEGTPTFGQFMGLYCFLEDLLGARIDLADRAALRPAMRPAIEREALLVA